MRLEWLLWAFFGQIREEENVQVLDLLGFAAGKKPPGARAKIQEAGQRGTNGLTKF